MKFKNLFLFTIIFLMIFAFLNEKQTRADDKLKKHLFKQGDSVVTLDAAPNTDCFIEAADKSSGSGTDTLKVYLVDYYGNETLANLKKMNVDDTITVNRYSAGVIVTSTSAGSYWKVSYDYPTQIKVVRSNAVNLTDTSWCIIKAMKKAGGALRSGDIKSFRPSLSNTGWDEIPHPDPWLCETYEDNKNLFTLLNEMKSRTAGRDSP